MEFWPSVFEQEDTETYILSLVNDIIASSQALLFEKTIDRQLVPFATESARDTLVAIIDARTPRLN